MIQTRWLIASRAGATLLALLLVTLHAGCQEPSSAAAPRRFEVHAVQTSAGPILVRFDSATGELVQSPLTGGRAWEPLGSAPETSGPERRAGRYTLDYVQAPSIPLTFIRLDTDSGAVWRMRHPGDRDWTALESSRSALAQRDEPVTPRPSRERAPRSPSSPESSRPTQPEAVLVPTEAEVGTLIEAAVSAELPSDMRGWAVEQLGNTQSEKAVGELIELLGDEDPVVVRSAARALAKHDDPRVRPALEGLQQHQAPEIRRVAETALSKLR